MNDLDSSTINNSNQLDNSTINESIINLQNSLINNLDNSSINESTNGDNLHNTTINNLNRLINNESEIDNLDNLLINLNDLTNDKLINDKLTNENTIVLTNNSKNLNGSKDSNQISNSKINKLTKSISKRKKSINLTKKLKLIDDNSNIDIIFNRSLFNSIRSEEDYLNDSEFDFYYNDLNLFKFDAAKQLNNKYKVFVKRYFNEIRVFRPFCIVKESNSILSKIIGCYCLDDTKLTDQLPDNLIYPLNSNKNNENVKTIRKLIINNPIDDLPIINQNEINCNQIDQDENNPTENDKQKLNKKRDNNLINIELDKVSNVKLNSETSSLNNELIESNIVKSNSNQSNSIKKSNSNKSTGRPAHCPQCYRLFSATFNAKIHYNGRFKDDIKIVACRVARINNLDNENLDPIVCKENCWVCKMLSERN